MKKDFSDEIAAQMQSNLTDPEQMSVFASIVQAHEKCSKCECAPCECDKHSVKDSKDEDSCMADDKDSKDSDSSDADDEVALALNQAINGLLSASAALDAVGFTKSATLSLDLAQFVVEAKKKAKKKKKSDKKSDSKKSDSKKSDKKSDSKKSDSKKSTKK